MRRESCAAATASEAVRTSYAAASPPMIKEKVPTLSSVPSVPGVAFFCAAIEASAAAFCAPASQQMRSWYAGAGAGIVGAGTHDAHRC